MNESVVSFRIEGRDYIEVTLPLIEFKMMGMWDKLQSYQFELFGDGCCFAHVALDNRIIEPQYDTLNTYDNRQKRDLEWNYQEQ